jgi:hypothetical protein
MEPREETDLDSLVGKVMTASTALATELERCIRASSGAPCAELLTPLVRGMPFDQQMQKLHELVAELFDSEDPAFVEFERWRRRLNRMQARRDELIPRILQRAASRSDAGELGAELGRIEAEAPIAAQWAVRLKLQTDKVLLTRWVDATARKTECQ